MQRCKPLEGNESERGIWLPMTFDMGLVVGGATEGNEVKKCLLTQFDGC